MNKAADAKLDGLRADFQAVVGRPFRHFYCPVLFADEPARLCRGHIINSAFLGSDKSWTIQRADVDAFFGSFFESEFLAVQERGKHRFLDILRNPKLWRLLRPKIAVEGREVEYYLPEGPVPVKHSELAVEDAGRPAVRLAMKLEPSETLAALQRQWEVVITKDIRLAALVSLLKAAHLTLFQLVGYSYALSSSGYFMGHEVLGKFFRANSGKSRSDVLTAANDHFREFINLVRPVLRCPPGLRGTTTDRLMYLCTGSPRAWGFLVLVRTGQQMHAVIAPVLEDAEGAARFAAFLRDPPPRFEVKLTKFAGHQWEVARDSTSFDWPAANFT